MPWKRPGLLLAPAAIILLAAAPGWAQVSPAHGGPRVIVSLGNDQFIPKAAIEGITGARFQSDLAGLGFLDEVSVIVLADISYDNINPFIAARLADWVNLGGSLLFTGGNNSFGLGGYVGTPVGSILPLIPDARDKTLHQFGFPLPIDASHPALAGITVASMGVFNETTLASDATLILQYRAASKGAFGGGGMTGAGRTFITTVNPKTGQGQVTLGTPSQSQAGQVTNPVTGQTVAVGAGSGTVSTGPGGAGQSGILPGVTSTGQTFDPGFATQGGIQGGGGGLPWPLLAERHVGQGIVLGTALDMVAMGDWNGEQEFVTNMILYLLHESKLPRLR